MNTEKIKDNTIKILITFLMEVEKCNDKEIENIFIILINYIYVYKAAKNNFSFNKTNKWIKEVMAPIMTSEHPKTFRLEDL